MIPSKWIRCAPSWFHNSLYLRCFALQVLWRVFYSGSMNSNPLSTLTVFFHRTFSEFFLHRKCILNYLGIRFVFYLYVARNLPMLCIIHTHTLKVINWYIFACVRFMQSSVSLQGYYRLYFITLSLTFQLLLVEHLLTRSTRARNYQTIYEHVYTYTYIYIYT